MYSNQPFGRLIVSRLVFHRGVWLCYVLMLSESEAFQALYVSDPAFREGCRSAGESDSFSLKAELRAEVAAWSEEHQV